MPNSILTSLLIKTHQRLSKGMQPGAYAELKKDYPEEIAGVEKKLEDDFTEDGIMNYQRRMIKGFKLLNLWRTI